MICDYNIFEAGLEVKIEVYIDGGITISNFSESDPRISPAYKAFMQRLNEKGWTDKDNRATMAMLAKSFVKPLPDGSKIFTYSMKPDTPSNCYH